MPRATSLCVRFERLRFHHSQIKRSRPIPNSFFRPPFAPWRLCVRWLVPKSARTPDAFAEAISSGLPQSCA
jgi:hypothetical protein